MTPLGLNPSINPPLLYTFSEVTVLAELSDVLLVVDVSPPAPDVSEEVPEFTVGASPPVVGVAAEALGFTAELSPIDVDAGVLGLKTERAMAATTSRPRPIQGQRSPLLQIFFRCLPSVSSDGGEYLAWGRSRSSWRFLRATGGHR